MGRPLHEELKQGKPFDLVEEEVHVSIARTAAVLERAFAKLLKPRGITPTQYNVLRILRGAGSDGLCRHEIGARLVTAVPDVTRLLDRMERDGLVFRQRVDADRRLVRTMITRRGREIVDGLDFELRTAHRTRLAHLSPETLRQLADLLADVRSAEDQD
ncbi:MAG: MarR family winged helix-turn-helix transcriptional regulator [Vicinamibacterales bacterium]